MSKMPIRPTFEEYPCLTDIQYKFGESTVTMTRGEDEIITFGFNQIDDLIALLKSFDIN